MDFAVCGADFIFLLFSCFSMKISIKSSHKPQFHHSGAECLKSLIRCLYYTINLKAGIGRSHTGFSHAIFCFTSATMVLTARCIMVI